jgi:hypothetical protein
MTDQASLLLRKQLRGKCWLFRLARCFGTDAVYAELSKHPVEGFSAGLADDVNLFEWQVTIMGPPDTL